MTLKPTENGTMNVASLEAVCCHLEEIVGNKYESLESIELDIRNLYDHLNDFLNQCLLEEANYWEQEPEPPEDDEIRF
jgi:hypothetical protein